MSRMVRSAATVLLFSLFVCSNLSALPLTTRITPSDADQGGAWTALVEWINSLFTGTTDSPTPASAKPKEGSVMDPDGQH